MRPVQQGHLSPVVRLFVGHKAHVQAAFCSRELLRHAFRCFDDPEVKCFALHDELVFVLQFLLNLFDVLAGEARHDTVHQRGIHAACPFEPCREILAELPEVDVLSDDSFQMMPVLENQFAGKNNQSLAFVAMEMKETMVEQLRQDIRDFKAANGCSRIVVLWAASTEIYVPVCEEVHGTLAALEQAMKNDDREHVAPSMCYAYAALAEGAPFIMGAPNTTVDIPAMWEMAEKTKMPIAGKDFKTGQTLVKSGFAPIIGTRCLGLSGWFSTNILGNRDGLVLDEPANFHTKEVSKLSTLESILVPENQPDLYTDYYHKVRINYYPPRNDNKEGWDNIDIFGWMGYPMQIKINFLCRDSILAAPLCLDLVLLSDLAARAGRYGIQRFLSFFLKSPMHDYTADEVPVNHLFQQYVMLKNALREMGGYEADEEID